MIILYKYLNLGGDITSKDISKLYLTLCSEVQMLEENMLTIFYRFLAEYIKNSNTKDYKLVIPKFPLIASSTHTNSELPNLLLIVYPSHKQQIYSHYYLKSMTTSRDDSEP